MHAQKTGSGPDLFLHYYSPFPLEDCRCLPSFLPIGPNIAMAVRTVARPLHNVHCRTSDALSVSRPAPSAASAEGSSSAKFFGN